jgi:serine/threonine-protein kinase
MIATTSHVPDRPCRTRAGGAVDAVAEAKPRGAATDGAVPNLVGERAGPFRLVREIGRGGMSVVYLAERVTGGFEQRVAVKVLPDTDDDSLLTRRFEQERQILAELEHPHGARLLDGGRTSPRGLAYLAMEYVGGRPIDRHCDEARLDLDARLALFLQVADAVALAHRQRVIHRDIKPANILVDHHGNAKLLDFGIAKLIADRTSKRVVTGAEERFLSLDYASPEQFRGETVTETSDVYQLGLVLFELLAGERAHRTAGLGFAEVLRLVCRQEPSPPSARRSGGAVPADLDAVVLRALRKDPALRYATVAELAADLRRFRAGLPVMARPSTILCRARNYVRRHRLVASATGALLFSHRTTTSPMAPPRSS